MFSALAIPIKHGVNASIGAVLDSCHGALCAQIQVSGGLGARNFRVQGAPFRGHLAALHAEPLLDAESAAVEGARIDGHMPGVNPFVTELFCSRVHYLEIIGSWQSRHAVSPSHPQASLGKLVVAEKLIVREWPVDE